MMKKYTFRLLTFVLMLVTVLVPAASFAAIDDVPADDVTIEYFEDGCTLETTIEYEISDGLTTFSSKSVSGSATKKYKDAKGNVLWYVKVTGTFSYGNGSATCTKSSVTAASNSKLWVVSDKTHSRSGNKAIATATGKKYSGKAVLRTVTAKAVLSCSPTGKLS